MHAKPGGDFFVRDVVAGRLGIDNHHRDPVAALGERASQRRVERAHAAVCVGGKVRRDEREVQRAVVI